MLDLQIKYIEIPSWGQEKLNSHIRNQQLSHLLLSLAHNVFDVLTHPLIRRDMKKYQNTS